MSRRGGVGKKSDAGIAPDDLMSKTATLVTAVIESRWAQPKQQSSSPHRWSDERFGQRSSLATKAIAFTVLS